MHVIAGLDPAHGGPSYTVPRLCQALTTAGSDARLFSVATADRYDITVSENDGRCFPRDWARVPVVRELCCSSTLARALQDATPKVDLIHDHGIWLMPNVDAGRAALRARKPFIVAPRGMLGPAALGFSRIRSASSGRCCRATWFVVLRAFTRPVNRSTMKFAISDS